MTEGEKIPLYFADPEMSDVCLVVGDKEFHVHKTVLAVRSKYFKALFYSDFKEKNEERIDIVADPLAFQRMLEFIYNGRLSDPKVFDTCPRKITNEFWDHATALWKVFDQFDCPHGRDLFLELTKKPPCDAQQEYHGQQYIYGCMFCVDRVVFALVHGIEYPKCASLTMSNWICINPDLPMDLSYLKKVFSQIIL